MSANFRLVSRFRSLVSCDRLQTWKKTPARSNKLNGLGRSQAKLSHCGVVFVQLKKCRDKKLLKFDLSITLVLGTSKEHRQWLGWSHPTFFPFLIDPYPNCGPTITSKYCFCWKPHGWLSSSFSKAAAQTLSKKITWAEKLGQFLLGKPFILATLLLGLPKNNTWADHPCGEKTWSPILWPCKTRAGRPRPSVTCGVALAAASHCLGWMFVSDENNQRSHRLQHPTKKRWSVRGWFLQLTFNAGDMSANFWSSFLKQINCWNCGPGAGDCVSSNFNLQRPGVARNGHQGAFFSMMPFFPLRLNSNKPQAEEHIHQPRHSIGDKKTHLELCAPPFLGRHFKPTPKKKGEHISWNIWKSSSKFGKIKSFMGVYEGVGKKHLKSPVPLRHCCTYWKILANKK